MQQRQDLVKPSPQRIGRGASPQFSSAISSWQNQGMMNDVAPSVIIFIFSCVQMI